MKSQRSHEPAPATFPPGRLATLPWAALLCILCASTPGRTQVFQVQGGTSSLFRAHGGTVEFKAPNYEGWVGLGGSLGEPRFGAFLRTQYRGYTLSFGDDAIRFQLPTDIFNTSHYFLGRGVGVAQSRERFSFFGFAGTNSTSFGAPYFRAAQAERGIGVFFLQAPITPRLRAFSHNVVADRQTSIHGVDWQRSPNLRMAVAGGVGANQGYFASSLSAERDWISVQAAYVRAGDQFRRLTVEKPVNSEVDRENFLLTVRPKPQVTFSVGRQNFLQPSAQGGGGVRAAVNHYLASFNVAQFRLGTTLYDAQVRDGRTLGSSLWASRDVAEWLQVSGNLLYSRPAQGPSGMSVQAIFAEAISPRLSLLQLATRADGHSTFSFGGEFLSNRITIGVTYQTLFIPFLTGTPFKQALVLNVRLQPFGNYQINAGTYMTPDGKLKYTVSGTTFLYRDGGLARELAPAVVALHENIVRGRVTDEEGKPIAGATLRIDGDVVFTDSQGQFFVRKRKARTYQLVVLLEEFLVPGRFELISAPATVNALPEDRAPEVTIVLRRLASSSP